MESQVRNHRPKLIGVTWLHEIAENLFSGGLLFRDKRFMMLLKVTMREGNMV
jgi:hypothetical protein